MFNSAPDYQLFLPSKWATLQLTLFLPIENERMNKNQQKKCTFIMTAINRVENEGAEKFFKRKYSCTVKVQLALCMLMKAVKDKQNMTKQVGAVCYWRSPIQRERESKKKKNEE